MFNAIIAVSGSVISVLGAFVVAFLIYLQQKRDEFRRKINRDFRNLDDSIINLSTLEKLKTPQDHQFRPEVVPQASIAVSEHWDESPEGIFDEDIDNLKEKFQEAREQENEIPAPNPARSALYLQVSFPLDDLIRKIYQEFPQPPAVYISESEENRFPEIHFGQFFTDEFPKNVEEIKEWIERFNRYSIEVGKVYQEIQHIVYKLVTVKKESAKRQKGLFEKLGHDQQNLFQEGDAFNQFQEDSFNQMQKLELGQAQYYDKFFDSFGEFKEEVRDRKSVV